ncbi:MULTISPECIES: polysaccharide lyase family 7 protein [unclassified Pseudomonas]|uniref:polysaccharide lyase family 7 protein n=1 Tax=unclassified Pseudomonas TaxID=196821 RepID=UPI0021BA8D6A|nr:MULTISPECIES: polysaccharide lyase family 7 protein [unclassified Pseudomonas]MCT8167049.1 polysaccharide lyase family 7 protein [Pseudomonas sp. HD6422]MCT8186028.1 polysaccharide lyase family 7 protein [Pseudomonas sp. HD6421]
MTVNINDLTITTPVPVSSTNPVALEVSGAVAIAEFPSVVEVLSDGSVQFSAPTKGASSKSTHRTRCEWSEATNWTLGSAPEHWNRQEMKLTKVNAAQKVVISQMHVRGDDSPPIKVFWNKGNITLGFRTTYNQATPVNSTVLKGVPLGAKFNVNIHVMADGKVTVTAECNGASGSSGTLQLDDTWDSHLFEFHGGVYNQIDYTDATPADDGSICIISSLSLIHS